MKTKMKVAIYPIVLLFLVVFMNSTQILGVCNSSLTINNGANSLMERYPKHEPIWITSNEDFVLQGWPGTGTKENPFKIENVSITSEGSCIWIIRVTVYFIIRFCHLNSSTDSESAINLRLSPNGSVYMCTIQSTYDGITLYKSPSSLVENCTFIDCPAGGTIVSQSPSCTITNNTFSNTGILVGGNSIYDWIHEISLNTINELPIGYFDALFNSTLNGSEFSQLLLVNCTDVTIIDGIFYNSSWCMSFSFCKNCSIIQCQFNNCTYPLRVANSNSCSFEGNTIVDGIGFGFEVDESKDCRISNNVILTDGDAISGYSIVHCNISHNYIPYSGRGGISLIDAQDCDIIGNYVNGTGMSGIDILVGSLCRIADNAVTYNDGPSIILFFTNRCIIQNNSIAWGGSGIAACDSESISILNNTMQYSSSKGIFVSLSNNCTVETNSIYRALDSGMEVSNSHNCNIRKNSISYCQGDGILQHESTNCSLSQNTVWHNRMSGIVLTRGSNNNILTSNNITNNQGYGIRIAQSINCTLYSNILGWNLLGNAVDNGSNNKWDDGFTIGNIWSDLNGSLYEIPGSAASIDRFPTLLPSDETLTATVISSTTNDFVITIPYFLVAGAAITSFLVISIYLIAMRRRH